MSTPAPPEVQNSDGPLAVETPTELAQRWRISRTHLYDLLDQGLPSRKLGRNRRFISAEVDRWLQDQAA